MYTFLLLIYISYDPGNYQIAYTCARFEDYGQSPSIS